MKSIISAGLVGYLVLLVLGYLIYGATPYFDLQTLGLGLGLGLLITVAHVTERNSRNPLVAMLAALFLINVFGRLLSYLYFPGIVAFPFAHDIGVSEINNGLIYVLFGTLCILGGIVLAARLWPVREYEVLPESPIAQQRMLWIWGGVFFIELLIELYFTAWLEMNVFKHAEVHENGHQAIQALRAIVGLDTTLLAFFTYLALPGNWRDSRKEWIWVIILGMVTLTYTAYSGSRGGGVRLLLFSIAVLLVWQGKRPLAASKVMVFLLAVALISGASFSVGDYFRTQRSYGHALQSAAPPVSNVPATASSETPLGKALNRLGAGLDYAVYVTTHSPGKDCASSYLNYQYFYKSVVNFIVPGAAFPEATINTSRVFSICYRGMDTSEVLSGYHSEYWTLWGLALIMAGWWGGLILMVANGILLYALYACIHSFFPIWAKPYFATLFVFAGPGLFVFSMGFDHTAITAIQLGAQLTCVLLLTKGLSVLSRKFTRAS